MKKNTSFFEHLVHEFIRSYGYFLGTKYESSAKDQDIFLGMKYESFAHPSLMEENDVVEVYVQFRNKFVAHMNNSVPVLR